MRFCWLLSCSHLTLDLISTSGIMPFLKIVSPVTCMASLAAMVSLLLYSDASGAGLEGQYAISDYEYRAAQVRSDTLRLTPKKVKRWIQTRIAEAKLQNKMKANAADYDNLIQAFYAERQTLVKQYGWSVTDYETVQDRIQAAISAMDISEEQAASRDEHEQQIAEIKANTYLSDKQKQQMIGSLRKVRQQERVQFIEPTKPDWQAVRPFRSTLEHMTDWIAGPTHQCWNRTNMLALFFPNRLTFLKFFLLPRRSVNYNIGSSYLVRSKPWYFTDI